METTPPITGASIGQRLQRLRQERGLSLRTLAAETGFSPSFLSQVENGQVSPSIASLDRLVRVLGVGLAEFFGQAAEDPVMVFRSGDRRKFTSEWSRARLESMLPSRALEGLEGLLITLEPGGRSGKTPSSQSHEQLALVLEGEIVLTLGDQQHPLREGDSAGIPAGCPHLWANEGERDARIAVVISRRP